MKNKIMLISMALLAIAIFSLAVNAQTYYGYDSYGYGNTAVDYYHYPTFSGTITPPSYYTTTYYNPYSYGGVYSNQYNNAYGYQYSADYSSGYYGYAGYSNSYPTIYCEDPAGNQGETKILGINPQGQYICANGRWMFTGYVSGQPVQYGYSDKLAFYGGVLEPPYNYQYNQPPQRQPLVYARATPTVEVTYYETYNQRKNCIDPYGMEGEHKIIGLSKNEYQCSNGVWVLVRDNTRAEVSYDYYTYTSRPTQYFVEIKSNGFNPGFIAIKVGDTITFINKDIVNHWPASDPHPTHTEYPQQGGCIGSMFDACHELVTNSTFSFTFTKAGVWGYHDHLDPFQTGTIRVDP